jgi:predicted Fe-S protein YdhL (DUF1289 family)
MASRRGLSRSNRDGTFQMNKPAEEPLTAQEMQKRSAAARWGKLTPEERSETMRELARKGTATRWGKTTKKQRSEMMRELVRRRWAAVGKKS